MEKNKFNPSDFLLSIVIPVFNEEETIAEIIDLVLKTSYQKEVIVVDDGSEDHTRDILRKIETRILKSFFTAKTPVRAKLYKPGSPPQKETS